MTDRTEYLITRLNQQREQTLSFFRSLTPDQWNTKVHNDEGAWDVRTLLGHFITSEASMVKLCESIIESGTGSPEDFDLNRFNAGRAKRMDEMTPEMMLAGFDDTRAATIEYVRTLTDEQLDKSGRHASQGMQTVEGIIKIIYKHNQAHEIDIRKSLGMPEPERPKA